MESHLKMAPDHRKAEFETLKHKEVFAKKSAVMFLFFQEDEKLKLIFIRRSDYVGIHAGQIALPGGRFEEEDGDVLTTAFRETFEEIGISPSKIKLLGRLSDLFIPPSNFLASVFVGYLSEKPIYTTDEREVQSVIEVDFSDFYTQGVVKDKHFRTNGPVPSTHAPYYDVAGVAIWGATAMMLSELLDVLDVKTVDVR